MNQSIIIGVMGSADVLPDPWPALARELGERLAHKGYILLTGGRTGVMRDVSQGAAEAGGQVVGILPGRDRSGANEFVTIPVVTGMQDARNLINILSSHVIVAFPGGGGTLTEIGMALKNRVPVINLGLWKIGNAARDFDHLLLDAHTLEEAMQQIETCLTDLIPLR